MTLASASLALAVLSSGWTQPAATETPPQARVERANFGELPDGRAVERFTLRNRHGMVARIMTLGATVTELLVPDRHGRTANVILGSDQLEDFLKGRVAAASVIGRFANRIAGAQFTLDGQTYTLAANNGTNHIHGGRIGFARVVWDGEALPERGDEASVRLTYRSADGEEGYPGNLTVTVTYTLTDANELRLVYTASTDKPTVVNLTNHAYFNLAGAGDALDHILWLDATRYTPANEQLIPTGATAPVSGTPLDFTEPTSIGARIEQLKPRPNGYDHNYVLGQSQVPRRFARLRDPKSGRVMEVSTTEPGVQLYSGNHVQHRGICLETQHYPDSPNQPHFPSTVVRPGRDFRSVTVFRFLNDESAAQGPSSTQPATSAVDGDEYPYLLRHGQSIYRVEREPDGEGLDLKVVRWLQNDGVPVAIFRLTNPGQRSALVWNVRQQVSTPLPNGTLTFWETLQSDYPARGWDRDVVPPGGSAEFPILSPSDSDWRVCLLYSREMQHSASPNRRFDGTYEAIGPTVREEQHALATAAADLKARGAQRSQGVW